MIPTMVRAFLCAGAGIALFGSYAHADDFDFTFTNTLGNVSGTVTGEITGLVNNATTAATAVIILTSPAIPGVVPDTNTTEWTDVINNSFTETNGQITSANYNVANSNSIPYTQFELSYSSTDPYDENLRYYDPPTGTLTVFSNTVAFSPIATPDPASVVLLSTLLLAVALVARKRIEHSR